MPSTTPKLSICIPAYDMQGKGRDLLERSFHALARQSFRDFEVIVSDQSDDGAIKALCDRYQSKFPIHRIENRDGKRQASANCNNAIRHARGEIIKILFQDDYLFCDDALAILVERFAASSACWSICACEHSTNGKTHFRPFQPAYHRRIQFGKNTISSPSVIALRRDTRLEFDEALIWLMDVDFYKRCNSVLGTPLVIEDILVVNRLHEGQVSNSVEKPLIRRELRHVRRKFTSQMTLGDWFHYLKMMFRAY